MCTYLAKRGATYYFRRVIPAELREILGRSEWMTSLRTKDRAQAKRLIPIHAQSTDRQIVEAERRLAAGRDDHSLTPQALETMAFDAHENALREARRDDVAGLIEMLEARLKAPHAKCPATFAPSATFSTTCRPTRQRIWSTSLLPVRDSLSAIRSFQAAKPHSDPLYLSGRRQRPLRRSRCCHCSTTTPKMWA